MTVYLAGPMTGIPNYNFEAFYAAESALLEQGYRVLNPARLGCVEGLQDWKDYWPLNEAMLRGADAICMLEGWENSPGAFREHAWATEHGLTVLREDRPKRFQEENTMMQEPFFVKTGSAKEAAKGYAELLQRYPDLPTTVVADVPCDVECEGFACDADATGYGIRLAGQRASDGSWVFQYGEDEYDECCRSVFADVQDWKSETYLRVLVVG